MKESSPQHPLPGWLLQDQGVKTALLEATHRRLETKDWHWETEPQYSKRKLLALLEQRKGNEVLSRLKGPYPLVGDVGSGQEKVRLLTSRCVP